MCMNLIEGFEKCSEFLCLSNLSTKEHFQFGEHGANSLQSKDDAVFIRDPRIWQQNAQSLCDRDIYVDDAQVSVRRFVSWA